MYSTSSTACVGEYQEQMQINIYNQHKNEGTSKINGKENIMKTTEWGPVIFKVVVCMHTLEYLHVINC